MNGPATCILETPPRCRRCIPARARDTPRSPATAMAGELPASGPPTRRPPATPWRRRAARCSPGRVARGSVGAGSAASISSVSIEASSMTTVRYPLVLRAFRIKYLAVTRGSDEASQPRPGQLSERGDLARSRMLSCSRTPYLLYELDRMSNDHVPVTVVDRGAFPDDVVRSAHPLPAKSAIDDPVDPCRVGLSSSIAWRRPRIEATLSGRSIASSRTCASCRQIHRVR